MAVIVADYGVLAAGQEGLIAAWQRIEGHLAELDRTVAATQDMKAATLTSYAVLKAKWTASAGERQQVLRALSDLVEQARQEYQRVDAALAAQFAG